MAAPKLMAGQRGGENQQGGGIRYLLPEKLGKGDIEGAQPVMIGPAAEESQ
jgi:hypothetical protein